MIVITLSLDERSLSDIDDLRWQNRVNRSEMFRMVFGYFKKNPEELKHIIENERMDK